MASGIQLQDFNASRSVAAAALRLIEKAAQALEVEAIVNAVRQTLQEMERERFNVVVVGEFSRGKSTFINALLGKRVLPSSPTPTTAVLSKITYRKEPCYNLHYRDGRPARIITEQEFHSIVAPEEPLPGDAEGEAEYRLQVEQLGAVAYADIGYPAALCQGGIEIVDTPGTNDLDAAREEITYRFIPQSDAAIMLLSAKMPLAETEMNFIRDRIIASDIQKIFLVVNFKDALKSDNDRQKVMGYIEERIQRVIPEPRLYMLSAKQTLQNRRQQGGEDVKGATAEFDQTGFMAFEQALGEFLERDRGRIKLIKPVERGLRLIDELKRNHIRIIQASLSANLESLDSRLDQIREELNRAERVCAEAIHGLKRALDAGQLLIRQDYINGMNRTADVAVQAVTNYIGPLEKEEILRAVENAVATVQTEWQSRIRKQQETLIEEEFERANRRIQYELDSVEATIVEVLELGDHEDGTRDELIVRPDEGEVAVKTGLGSLGLLGFAAGVHMVATIALPFVMFGGSLLYGYFKMKMREKVLGEVRVQVERRYRDVIPSAAANFDRQWSEMTERATSAFRDEVQRKLSVIRDQVEAFQEARRCEQSHAEERVVFLDEQTSLLDNAAELLTGLQERLKD